MGVSKKAEIKVQGVMGEPVGGQWVREQCSYSWLQVYPLIIKAFDNPE